MKKVCKQCGKEFELSQSEIDFYKSKGLELPKRCKMCRNKNKVQNKQINTKANDSYRKKANRSNNKNTILAAILVMAFAIGLLGKAIFSYYEHKTYSENHYGYDVNYEYESQNVLAYGTEPDESLLVQETESDESLLTQETESDESFLTQETESDESFQLQETKLAAGIQPQETEALNEDLPQEVNLKYSFRKAEYLTEHFQKHGAEFPYNDEAEYLNGANKVIGNPASLHKLEVEDNDDIYYLESTNELVIVSTDGFIRTYFKPNGGINYYNSQ